MRKLILILMMFGVMTAGATTFTEFCVRPDGNNLNAGSTTNASPTYECDTGTWDSATGIYTPTDGSTPASTVTNGAWASIYTNTVTVNPVFIALVTNVAAGVNGAITVSLTAKGGTAPTTDAAGYTVIRVGGAWSGPNTNQNPSCGFPFSATVVGTMTNNPLAMTRINVMAAQYNTTNALTHSGNGPLVFQGYTTTFGDGGRAILDGGTVYPGYALINITGNYCQFEDFIFCNNGASGATHGVTMTGSALVFRRCVVHHIRGSGFYGASSGESLFECEAYTCNQNSQNNNGGFNGGTFLWYCMSHDNATANGDGFYCEASATLIKCSSWKNGRRGFVLPGNTTAFSSLLHCNAYSNSSSGVDLTGTGVRAYFQNCNFVKNAAYGIANSGGIVGKVGAIVGCGFGYGTSTNVSGNIQSMGGIPESGSVLYTNATPWTDPDNGDFRPTALAKGLGREVFTQITVNSPTNTVGYPDIGAAQSTSTNAASGGEHSHVFAQ